MVCTVSSISAVETAAPQLRVGRVLLTYLPAQTWEEDLKRTVNTNKHCKESNFLLGAPKVLDLGGFVPNFLASSSPWAAFVMPG